MPTPNRPTSESSTPMPQAIKGYIVRNDTAREMVQYAQRLGKELKQENVTTSQIRNAYGKMKKLEMFGWEGARTQREVLLLKPRLAYAAGRHGDKRKDQQGLYKLQEVMNQAIDSVTDEESFQRFCQFFEAIVAYHKAAGGK